MSHELYSSGSLVLRTRRSGVRKACLAASALIGLSGLAALGELSWRSRSSSDGPGLERGPAPAGGAIAPGPAAKAWMLDPAPVLESETLRFRQGAPLPAAPRLARSPDLPGDPPAPKPARPLPPSPTPEAAQPRPAAPLPLPVPRPADLQPRKDAEPPRMADSRIPRRTNAAAAPAATEDDRSFFEKFFGLQRSSGPALSYASLGHGPAEMSPRPQMSPSPLPDVRSATAIYDITARVVHMPNGEKLEAHSGLGETMDDPRYVHLRMRGATPPGTYDLREREQPFHGVRALRLNPVGGSAAVHGRNGLLAHTYLLGPSGASNGCVSFKDYDRFLQAYLRGEVRRLVVVTALGSDGGSRLASR